MCVRSRASAPSLFVPIAMAPRRETAFEKSERKRIEAQKELTKGQVQEINKNMKQHPQLVPALYEAMQRAMREGGVHMTAPSLGAGSASSHVGTPMLALPAPPLSVHSAPCNASASAGSASIAGDVAGFGEDSEAGSSSGAASVASRSYRSLESSSVVFLQELLSAIEPVVFAKHAISIVTRRGARLRNIKALCEIIELCIGMAGAEQIIVGDDHSVTAVLKLRLSELNIAFGRRGLETPLPPTGPRTASTRSSTRRAAASKC